MRIALLSDIHGNSIALDAVLEDIGAQGHIDAHWILGDLVAIGPDPVGVLERLSKLSNVFYTRGNTDRYVVNDERPFPTFEQVRADTSLLPRLVEVSQSFAWTKGMITSMGWLDWLSRLPLEQRLELPDATRLLGVHASPGCDDGRGFHPASDEVELETLFSGCGAELVCVGHTHCAIETQVNDIHLVNLGPVSNPFPPDLRASYIILNADTSGYKIQRRKVDYDHEDVISSVHEIKHPAASYIVAHMKGQVEPNWRAWHADKRD